MEIFYSTDIGASSLRLGRDESAHCIKVLRHRAGDEISVIDGCGTLYRCSLTLADPKEAEALILERVPGFGSHPYSLTMAVCPTKNMDRYEWFVEKATEMGVDRIVPVIGEHSERRTVKDERVSRVVLSAVKQSLKGRIPELSGPLSVKEFIESSSPDSPEDALRLICCCFEPEGGRRSIREAISGLGPERPVSILIGPEGDFSSEELSLALSRGWIPVHLGDSRMRTETAAVFAVAEVYSHFML